MEKSHRKTKVRKIDNKTEDFSFKKVVGSIWFAAKNVGGKDKKRAHELGKEVMLLLVKKYPNGEIIKTSEIGETVEKVLIERGHAKTAQEFIRYRENKKHLHQDIDSLGVKDDIGLTYNTLYILKQRYLRRDSKGKIVETPRQMFARVAKFLSDVEKTKAKKKEWNGRFFDIMKSFEFRVKFTFDSCQ